jgi:DNA-binding response OmpR family regulator
MLPGRPLQKKALVVSGSKALLPLIARSIAQLGVEVRCASGGMDALEVILAPERKSVIWKPDVLIVDWQLSDLHGLEFLYIMRQDRLLEDIPVLLLGGKNAVYDSAGFLRSQMLQPDAYLNKPFNPSELNAQLRRLLDSETE